MLKIMVYAAMNDMHDFTESENAFEPLNLQQHNVITTLVCINCGLNEQQITKENHAPVWEKESGLFISARCADRY